MAKAPAQRSNEKPNGRRHKWRTRITRAIAGQLNDRDQLLVLLREASRRELISAEDFGMLEGALAVAEQQVRDIMVPRAEMICIRRDDPLARIVPAVIESGHSRFPVVDGDRDDVVGIMLAKDLLRAFAGVVLEPGVAQFDMREYLRPAVFVPEAKRLNVLLRDFRVNRNHMALVVDEYGGVAGLVTIEDVMEQIVGDIDDEFDVEDDLNIRPDGDHFIVRGATRISEFNEQFKTALSEDEFETVAGLVMQQFGRVPRRGESVIIAGWEFRVQRTDRRRIDSLRVAAPQAGVVADDVTEEEDG
jgi:magnesium and cobalt transporter